MKLILQNGFPYPHPEDFDKTNPDYDCRDHFLVIEGVKHFEWSYTVTVEFLTLADANTALELTGWSSWSRWTNPCILEAETSAPDGIYQIAIRANSTAYFGFVLVEST